MTGITFFIKFGITGLPKFQSSRTSHLLSVSLQLPPLALWGGHRLPAQHRSPFGGVRPHPCRALWEQCLSNPAARNVPRSGLLPKPFPAKPRDLSAVQPGEPAFISSISASLSALLSFSPHRCTQEFLPSFVPIRAFLYSQALKHPGLGRAGDGTETHPFHRKILMLLRHPVAHLGPNTSPAQPARPREAGGRKINVTTVGLL